MRLKHLLILAFIVLAAIPLFIGLQYLNTHTGAHYRQLFEDHLASISLIAKKRILTAVERMHDNTALVSSRTQLRLSLADWNQTRAKAQQEKISRIIHDAAHGLSHLKEISIYAEDGALTATTAHTPSLQRIDPGHWAKPRIQLQMINNELTAVSSAPLILQQETVGYIRLYFYTDVITDLIRDRTGLGETGEWLFAIRHESGDALFAVPLKYDHKAAFQRRVGKDRLDIPITQALLGNEIIMGNTPDYREVPVLASTRYISEMDWGLVAKINEDEVNALVNQNKTVIYFAEFVIVLMAIIAGIALSFYISNPIEKLRDHTSRVAKGSFEEPQAIGGWHEVQELTTNFSYMIKALRDLNDNLQRKVEERTAELNTANQQLEKLALHDPLTGLYNRRYFSERFSEELGRAKRYGNKLALVMFDIDNFKQVNDSYGHPTGDAVLTSLADYLKHRLRESDLLARIGGEEFCLVLPDVPQTALLPFLERLRSELGEIQHRADGKTFNVTCSFGVAYLDADSDETGLMEKADKALYQAKQGGRNCVVLAT